MGAYVVSGSASGLGAALCGLLAERGHRVLGIDRRDADVVADLGTPEGRAAALAAGRDFAAGRLEGVVSCAGLGPYDEPRAIVRVNYFGAVALLDGLLDPLAAGSDAAAVGIVSLAAAVEALALPALIEACHAGDEERAVAEVAGRDGNTAYCNAKRALAQAVRRRAPAWGARGVRLNAVGPGTMETPMLDRLLADEAHAPAIRALPVPLGRSAPAEEIARTVLFLLGPDAGYVHGQVLYVDGGSHAVMAPEHV